MDTENDTPSITTQKGSPVMNESIDDAELIPLSSSETLISNNLTKRTNTTNTTNATELTMPTTTTPPTTPTTPTPSSPQTPPQNPNTIYRNFLLFSTLFSLNHGAVVSCLSLATARLGGDLGAYQSGALYGSYTLSALFGATWVVGYLGGAGKGAVVAGMWVYCGYVAVFAVVAALDGDGEDEDGGGEESWWRTPLVIFGGLLGGIGGGFLWTAQGTYFSRVSSEYSTATRVIAPSASYQNLAVDGSSSSSSEEEGYSNHPNNSNSDNSTQRKTVEDASKELGGLFAAIYLTGEVTMRLLSTLALTALPGWSWRDVFTLYTIIALSSTVFMHTSVTHYPSTTEESPSPETTGRRAAKYTATLRLLQSSSRIQLTIPYFALFGFAAAFLTSFVNGQVLSQALDDEGSVYVGIFGSVTAVTAAVASLAFSRLAQGRCGGTATLDDGWRWGNGGVMVLGCVAFMIPSMGFVLRPEYGRWGLGALGGVYALQGVGRATFEGNLRAEFAVVFGHDEKEGAFGNIVFWNGLITTIGFILTANARCDAVSTYCVQYQDGSIHNVLVYELLVIGSGILAIGGLVRIMGLDRRAAVEDEGEAEDLEEDGKGVWRRLSGSGHSCEAVYT